MTAKSDTQIGIGCSCVGMVVHAIEEVLKQKPLHYDDSRIMPGTDLDDLEKIYPPNFVRRRHRVGLVGP